MPMSGCSSNFWVLGEEPSAAGKGGGGIPPTLLPSGTSEVEDAANVRRRQTERGAGPLEHEVFGVGVLAVGDRDAGKGGEEVLPTDGFEAEGDAAETVVVTHRRMPFEVPGEC